MHSLAFYWFFYVSSLKDILSELKKVGYPIKTIADKQKLKEDIEQCNLGRLYDETKNSTKPFVFKPINKRFVGYAIKELKKIKEEFPLDKIHEM